MSERLRRFQLMYIRLKLFWRAEHVALWRSAFSLRRWVWVLSFTWLF